MKEGTLPLSQCGKAFMIHIRPLLLSKILEEQRSRAGRRLMVLDRDGLYRHYHMRFPNGQPIEGTSARVRATAQFRDSKSLKNDTPEIVITRVMTPGALVTPTWIDPHSVTLDHRIYSFLLAELTGPTIKGSWALIENPAVFLHHEKIVGPGYSAILVRGKASDRLHRWLAGSKHTDTHFIHCPDYDPVGLSEFLRLHNRLGDKVRLYLPENLEELFDRFSARDLLIHRPQQTLLQGLRTSVHPGVQRVIALIDQYNGGLEQEALLVSL